MLKPSSTCVQSRHLQLPVETCEGQSNHWNKKADQAVNFRVDVPQESNHILSASALLVTIRSLSPICSRVLVRVLHGIILANLNSSCIMLRPTLLDSRKGKKKRHLWCCISIGVVASCLQKFVSFQSSLWDQSAYAKYTERLNLGSLFAYFRSWFWWRSGWSLVWS